MNEKTMKAMLKYLPCKAGDVPRNLRHFRDAEQAGLAVYGKDGMWTLTPKGRKFAEAR